MSTHQLQRLAQTNRTPLSEYLLTCKPSKAKKHLKAINSYFNTFSKYLTPEQRIMLKRLEA